MPTPATPQPGQPPRRGLRRSMSSWVAVVALTLAGCGVLELTDAPHEAVVLESAVPTDEGRWQMVVELLQTDIEGEAVVSVAFDGDEVSCVDGGSVPASELEPPTELRFEQGRDGVERGPVEDEPPVVSGVGVEVHCD